MQAQFQLPSDLTNGVAAIDLLHSRDLEFAAVDSSAKSILLSLDRANEGV